MVVHCANVVREVFVGRGACVSKIMVPPREQSLSEHMHHEQHNQPENALRSCGFCNGIFYVWMYGGGPPRSLRTLIKDLLREKNALEENTLPHTMPPGLIHTAVKMDRGQF